MFTLPFSELTSTDTSKAGGKGSSLGEMTRAGIPVPPGFVVLTNAFERVMNHSGVDARSMPDDIAAEILESFRALDVDAVAVRSSATVEDSKDAAWAGQLDTFLHVTEEQLLERVKNCWQSIFSERAKAYSVEKGSGKEVAVAVVVQAMIEADASGVAFSKHPVTHAAQVVIEAGFGLGEAIVSGQITPDTYLLDKLEGDVLNKVISSQSRALRSARSGIEWQPVSKGDRQKISDETIGDLAKMVQSIEQHYGYPVDIEWAVKDGRLYILQARPITA